MSERRRHERDKKVDAHSSETQWEFTRLIVDIQIIPHFPFPEDKVLLRDDDHKERDPITQNAQQVTEHTREVLPSEAARDRVRNNDDNSPNGTRDELADRCQGLEREGGGVGVGHVVRDDGHGEDDEDEFPETVPRREDLGEESADSRVEVGVAGAGDGHECCAEDLDEADGDPDSEEDEEEARKDGLSVSLLSVSRVGARAYIFQDEVLAGRRTL